MAAPEHGFTGPGVFWYSNGMNTLAPHTVLRIGWTLLAIACFAVAAAADGPPAKSAAGGADKAGLGPARSTSSSANWATRITTSANAPRTNWPAWASRRSTP